MLKKALVIIGAGGFAREVQWLAEEINSCMPQWELLGFIDDDIRKKGQVINGLPILGDMEWFSEHSEPVNVAFAVGNPSGRKKLVERFSRNLNAGFPNLIHPSVKLSSSVHMGTGNIICSGALFTTNIELGSFNIINLGCTVGHDVFVGDYCTIAPAANISGNVRINNMCEIGTNSCIIQNVSIGETSTIGAGSVVIRDIPPGCTAVGVPAKPIKFN